MNIVQKTFEQAISGSPLKNRSQAPRGSMKWSVAKRSFEDMRSQAGAWEREKNVFGDSKSRLWRAKLRRRAEPFLVGTGKISPGLVSH